ncbi:MAG: hypothetical protein E8D44_11470 [Nitrospira sp.]|jgi:cytochrome c2|nr:MAG: hypothetical protein E8D44_11470 [Nitrospira sp.]
MKLIVPDRGARWSGLFMGIFIAMVWIGGSEGASHDALSVPVAVDQTINPHSDLIFRATGAKTCRDCHQAERDQSLSPRTLDNDLVRNLRSKAKGIHGPGRFADCLRCHAGGRKGVEQY